MQITILSSGDGWHVRDLIRAATHLGHDAVSLDFRKIFAGVAREGMELPPGDRILVRTMPPGSLEQVVFRMDALHRWQAAGVPVLNPPLALESCIDKYLATAKLQAGGLPVPPTVVCQHSDAAMEAYESLGGDVVVKPLFGSEGRGMVRIADSETAWRTFRTLERLDAVLYLQEFIPHEGWDLRAFVIGDEILTAMRRRSNGDWRTNVAQGAKAEPAVLDTSETKLAIQAAATVGAAVCGVDLLPGKDGRMYVLEVNAVPGWRALATVTGVDVAVEVVRFLATKYGH